MKDVFKKQNIISFKLATKKRFLYQGVFSTHDEKTPEFNRFRPGDPKRCNICLESARRNVLGNESALSLVFNSNSVTLKISTNRITQKPLDNNMANLLSRRY